MSLRDGLALVRTWWMRITFLCCDVVVLETVNGDID